jgi:Flp pilus assembly protein TadD
MARAEICQGLGDTSGEETNLRKALEDGDYFGSAGEQLGTLLVAEHRYQEATTVLAGTVQRSPDNPAVLNYYGIALSNTGRLQDAIDAYKRAITLSP